jgi:hypothetical protein
MIRCLFRVLFSIMIVIAGIQPGWAQSYNFELRFANHTLGTIAAQRKVNGHSKTISITTRVKSLFSKVNQDILNEYRGDVLMLGMFGQQSGGKNGEAKETKVVRDGNGYKVTVGEVQSTLINTEITDCVAELYFAEPKLMTRIFSETLGKFLLIRPLGKGHYELALPEGKKNIYKYENGALMEVEVSHALGKAFIVRVS